MYLRGQREDAQAWKERHGTAGRMTQKNLINLAVLDKTQLDRHTWAPLSVRSARFVRLAGGTFMRIRARWRTRSICWRKA